MNTTISKIAPFAIVIDQEIFKKFPTAKISFALVKVIVNSKLKTEEKKFITEYKQKVVKMTTERGITLENYVGTKACISWRKVFETFKENPEYKSTIENLLKRVVQEAEKLKGEGNLKANLWNISNFVDVYNCVSVEKTTSMGAVDVSKIEGDIHLRFGKKGEKFIPLGKNLIEHQVTEDHVVYADQKSILTWLWNYKDSSHCCVPKKSPLSQPSYILLFAEQAEQEENSLEKPTWERPGDSEEAINLFKEHLPKINGQCLISDTLTREKPKVVIDLSLLK